MKHHTSIGHDGEGSIFSVSGTRGCVGRSVFKNELTLYRAELRALENCEIAARPPHVEPSVILSKYLVGESVLTVPNQQPIPQSPHVTFIRRVDKIESTYSIEKGQTIRYASVMIPVRVLSQQIGSNVPPVLSPFVSEQDDICHVSTVASNRKIHGLANKLFMTNSTDITQNLIANGLASLFIAEIISALCGQCHTKPDSVLDWETHVFSDLKAYIDANLGNPLSRALLAAKFSISESNLNRMFVKRTGQTYSDYVREKRLEAAHSALQNTTMTISQIAQSVGYNHLSNFSRAYSQRYGEVPSRIALRSRT